MVQEYSTSTSCLIPYDADGNDDGKLKIMVNARQVGSDVSYEKRCVQTITYD